MGTVAVIILSYNNYRETLKCLDSVVDSTCQDLEIHIVDNHSPDGAFQALQDHLTGQLSPAGGHYFCGSPLPTLESLVMPVPIFLWDTGANLGFAGGINFGARKASARQSPDYFLFLNNDTVLDRRCIQKLAAAALAGGCENIYAPVAFFPRPEVVFCGGMRSYIPGPFQFTYTGRRKVPQNQPYATPYLSGACFMVHRELFEQTCGMDESLFLYGEDVLFGEQVRRLGGHITMVPEAIFWHSGSKAIGRINPIKSYYMSRNILYLVAELSPASWLDQIRVSFYLVFMLLLDLATLKFAAARALLKGIHDFREGVKGSLVYRNQTVSKR